MPEDENIPIVPEDEPASSMPEDENTSRFKSLIGFLLVSVGLIILVWVAFTEYSDYSTSKDGAETISRQSQDGKTLKSGILPDFLSDATSNTKNAYLFASDEKNQPALEAAECFCQCGHDSLFGCFITERKPDGKIVFAEHGSRCGLCVNEVLFVKKLVGEGKSAEEVGELIDKEFGGR